MRALRHLLAEARARHMIAPLIFDAISLAVVGAFFAMFWIATPGDHDPRASAHPSPPAQTEAPALATGDVR